MKNLLLISIFISISIYSFSQTYKTEQEFKDYLIANIRTIDPIEGIWNGQSERNTKYYYDGHTMNQDGGGRGCCFRIIIIKERDNYVAYSSNEFSKKISICTTCCSDFNFEKTSSSNQYLFRFSCASNFYTGKAYMSDKVSLSFTSKDESYNSNGASSISTETFSFTKLSLNEDDIKNA